MGRSDFRPARGRRRRRAHGCIDGEDGRGLVHRQGAFDGHGDLHQLLADRHRCLAACVAADRRRLWRKRGESPVAALIVVATGLLALTYRSPATSTGTTRSSGRLGRHATMAVVCAGLIWALYNMGFVMIFSFGPSMLVERGWSITAAGSAISIVLWLSAVSVPAGGLLADRTGRHDAIMASCFFVTAMLLIVATRTDAIIATFIALGMLSGLAAGPILSLPSRVLEPGMRALGMGVFFSISYLGLVLGPTLGGRYATWSGSAAAAFDLGAAVILICPVVLWIFHPLQSRAQIRMQASPPAIR